MYAVDYCKLHNCLCLFGFCTHGVEIEVPQSNKPGVLIEGHDINLPGGLVAHNVNEMKFCCENVKVIL